MSVPNPDGRGGACVKSYRPLRQAEDVDPGNYCCNNHFNICINICILCFSDILTTVPFVIISVLQIVFVVILPVIHLVILSFILIIVFIFLDKHIPKGGTPKGGKGGKGNIDKAAADGDKDKNEQLEWQLHSSSRMHYLSDHIRRHHNAPYQCKNIISGCYFTTKSRMTLKEHETYYCLFKLGIKCS